MSWSEIAEKYKRKELNREQIAEQLALSRKDVYENLRRLGVKIWDTQDVLLKRRNKQIVSDFKNGMSRKELQEKYNLSRNAIIRVIWNAGLSKSKSKIKSKSKSRSKNRFFDYRELKGHIMLRYNV